jgi:hypothetical protein
MDDTDNIPLFIIREQLKIKKKLKDKNRKYRIYYNLK